MSNPIDRQAAIDAADMPDYTGFVVKDVKTATDEVVKELKRLPSAQLEQCWISCDQKLPNDDKPVLLTEEVRFHDGRRRRDVCMASYDSQNMTWYEILGANTLEIPYPIAWMPRPAPYE